MGKTRRGLLKGLTGTGIGGLLATVSVGEAAAKPVAPCKGLDRRVYGGDYPRTTTPQFPLCGGMGCNLQIGVSQCVAAGCVEGRWSIDIYARHTAPCTRAALNGGGPGICNLGYCAPISPS